MNVNPDGALFKITYGWGKVPNQTSVCLMFWRALLSLLIIWPWIFGTRLFGWIVRIVFAIPAFLLFGHRPAGPDWRFKDQLPSELGLPFVPIKWWPRTSKGIMIMPGVIILLIIVAAIIVWVVIYFFLYKFLYGMVTRDFFGGIVFGTTAGLWIFSSFMALAFLFILYLYASDTEGWRLFKAFVRAKKNKVCPLVTFEKEGDTGEDAPK